MDIIQLNAWFPDHKRCLLGEQIKKHFQLTQTQTECFVRLWIYLLIKQKRTGASSLQAPLKELEFLQEPIPCSQREAARLFYSDCHRGSSRSAGMMLEKLADLHLIQKSFNGRITYIKIQPIEGIIQSIPEE